MDSLSHEEKIAVLKILQDIIIADNVKEEREIELKNNILSAWSLSTSVNEEIEKFSTDRAVSMIRSFRIDKKNEVTKLMGSMIVVDKDINYKEVELYNSLCELCEMENTFAVEDYPDCTYSSPFTNPEDIIW